MISSSVRAVLRNRRKRRQARFSSKIERCNCSRRSRRSPRRVGQGRSNVRPWTPYCQRDPDLFAIRLLPEGGFVLDSNLRTRTTHRHPAAHWTQQDAAKLHKAPQKSATRREIEPKLSQFKPNQGRSRQIAPNRTKTDLFFSCLPAQPGEVRVALTHDANAAHTRETKATHP